MSIVGTAACRAITIAVLLGLPGIAAPPAAGSTASKPVPTKSVSTGAQSIEAGRVVYSQRCKVCHGQHGGRGPNLFETDLSDEDFMAIVMAGRSGNRGQMPAWSGILTVEQVRQVEVFVKSRPHF